MELKVTYIVDGCYSAILISKPMSKPGCSDCIFLNSSNHSCICNKHSHDLYPILYKSIDKLVEDNIFIKTACDVMSKGRDMSVIIDLYEYKKLSTYLARYLYRKYECSQNKV